MEDPNLYCVTVKVYTWAVDKKTALDQVAYTLDCLSELDNHIDDIEIPNDIPVLNVHGDLESPNDIPLSERAW